MPVNYIELNGIKGYRWGKQKFYSVKQFGERGAKQRAEKQGQAIELSVLRKGESRSVPVRASSRAKGYVKQI